MVSSAGRKRHVAFEFTTAEQETERYGIAALARMATGEGGDALGHQFDADPGRQAAVGAAEQAIGLDGERVWICSSSNARICSMRIMSPAWGSSSASGQSIMGRLR
jgi:hypothetical protein